MVRNHGPGSNAIAQFAMISHVRHHSRCQAFAKDVHKHDNYDVYVHFSYILQGTTERLHLLKAMTEARNVKTVEDIIGYQFQSKRNLLFQALTAEGADEADWDGNRRLARLGTALTEFLLVYLEYDLHAETGKWSYNRIKDNSS